MNLLLNLMNIVFYIILQIKLKDQNQIFLILLNMNNENIFILPYTIEFLIDM